MGWREGQGIGPKVRRPARLHDTEALSTHVPESHLFAPDDVAVVSVIRKIDHHGLGYGAMSAHYTHEPAGFTRRTNEEDVLNIDGFGMTGPSRSLMADRSKDTKGHGGGMGFGILNDNGSDDDDGYQMAPRISRTRTLTGLKKRKKKKLPSGMADFVEMNSTVHDPRSRALALGEAPLPGKSIFDFLSTAARERLVAASGRTNLPPAGGEALLAQGSKDGHEDSNTLAAAAAGLNSDATTDKKPDEDVFKAIFGDDKLSTVIVDIVFISRFGAKESSALDIRRAPTLSS
ncbi:hypothetical protein HYQ44_019625 [Verticillium longisporum]|nr:hypothetical protein HYQ44_019625 [Verticillium longisporum]